MSLPIFLASRGIPAMAVRLAAQGAQ